MWSELALWVLGIDRSVVQTCERSSGTVRTVEPGVSENISALVYRYNNSPGGGPEIPTPGLFIHPPFVL